VSFELAFCRQSPAAGLYNIRICEEFQVNARSLPFAIKIVIDENTTENDLFRCIQMGKLISRGIILKIHRIFVKS